MTTTAPIRRSQAITATLVATLLAGVGLLLDLRTPYGQAGGAAYVALVMTALWLPWRDAPWLLASTGTVLISAGYAAHAATATAWVALANRGLAVAVVWMVAVALGRYRRNAARSSRAGHLRALIDATADGVIMIDGRGTVQELNRSSERLFGYTADEVVGRNVSLLMPSPYREEHDGYLSRYRTTGVRRVIGRGRTVEGRRKDGSTFPLQLAVGEARHAGETIFVGTVRDLSERELAAHALKQAKEEAEAANRAKSLFLANMTHELRTPLNAILGYAQIMRHDATLPRHHRRAVRAILGAGDHLMELINEILDLSKIEAGAMELHPSDFSIAELVESLADLFAVRCAEKEIGWRVESDVDGAAVVHGDHGKLRQVLINFLGNAVKFTDRGEVVLRVARDGDAFRFEVADTGPGIPPEAQEQIFEPFSQAEEGRDKGGTGLGLAISRRQVEIMGGKVELDSEVGRGSRFSFTLTLPPGEPQVAGEGGDATPAPRVVGLAPGCTVEAVVADDVADNREILSQMLTGLGVKVRTATDGAEAVAQVEARPPDICFLDIRMGGMGGVEALRAIRDRVEAMVCVAVTAAGLAHQDAELRAAGFDEVVLKPFHFEQIHACLARHLGTHFRYAEGEEGGEPAALDLSAVTLPAPLHGRLTEAARLNAFTEVEGLLAEVAATGAAGEELATHLRTLLDRYDSDAILATLEHVTHG